MIRLQRLSSRLTPTQVLVTFSEAVDAATINEDTIILERSGGDGTFADGDEIRIAPVSVTRTAPDQATVELTGVSLPNDVYQVVVRGTSMPDTGLVAHWKFDETSGTTAADSSGNGNDATLIDGPTWQPASGVIGGALYFDDGNDYVNGGSGIDLASESFTVAGWTKRDSVTGGVTERWICQGPFEDNKGLHFAFQAGDIVRFGFKANDLDTYVVQDTQWHHWAGTYDTTTNTRKIYYDGAPVASDISPSDYTGTGDFFVGMGWDRYYAGLIDDVRIYNRALSPEEIGRLACPPVTDLAGNVLDGDGDTIPGGDYVSTFTIDAPLPAVQSVTPAPGAVLASPPTSISAVFTADMDASTIDTYSFAVVGSGGDGTFDDGNEVAVVPASVAAAGTAATMSLAGITLAEDAYRVTLSASPTGPWSVVTHETRLSSSSYEWVGSLNTYATEIHFFSDRPGGLGTRDIYMSTRRFASSEWGTPVGVNELNSSVWDCSPWLSADRLTVWFSTARSGGMGGPDIWMATRPDEDTPWSDLTVLTQLNSPDKDEITVVSPDGLAMWFSSDRAGGLGDSDIWYASRVNTSSPWSTPQNVAELNSPTCEAPSWISASKLEIYFYSKRAGTGDEWVARRPDVLLPWGSPDLVEGINSNGNDSLKWISPDGSEVYFSSTREGGLGGSDIYSARRAGLPIADALGNRLDGENGGTFPSGNGAPGGDFVAEFTVDAAVPTVVSVARTDSNPTTAATVAFTVLFSEGVSGVTPDDFIPFPTGGLTFDTPVAVVQVTPDVYTVTVSNISGDGTLRLDANDDDSILDVAGTPLGGVGVGNGDFTTGQVYTIDNDPPTDPVVAGTTPTSNARPTWTWTAGSGGAGLFRYGWSVGSWLAEDVTDTSYTPASDLTEGPHTLYVQERDDMSNWSAAGSCTIVVDLSAPNAPYVTGITPTTDTTPTWTWMSQGGGGNGLFRFGHTLGPWIAEDATDTSYTPAAPLEPGTHALYVQERDDAGNWSLPGSFGIVVEAAPIDDAHTPFAGGCEAGTASHAGVALLILLGAVVGLARRRRS